MKIADVRAKTDDELKKQATDLYKEEMNLRFQQANGQLKNTAEMRAVRRTIARVQTVLNERKLGIVANDVKEKKAAKKAPKKETAKKAAPKKTTEKKTKAKTADKK